MELEVSKLIRTADTTMIALFVIACACCALIIVGASLAACYSELLTSSNTFNRVAASVIATFIIVIMFAGADALVRSIMDQGWIAVLPYR